MRIGVGGQAQLIYLPALLARELGFYKDAGLNVSLTEFQGGASTPSEVAIGHREAENIIFLRAQVVY